MGKLCSKQVQSNSSTLIETEKEVTIPSFKSNPDKFYDLQENKFNYLHKINFADFLYSLVNFSNENATLEDKYDNANINYSCNSPFFCEQFSTDIFQSFIENKIMKHKATYEELGNNETACSIFKEYLLNMNTNLGLKLSQNAKANGDENADKDTIVKKGDAIGYGILYCCGANYIKIRAIFNLFKENNEIKKSEKFSGFLLSLFIIASYCNLSARNKLSKFEQIGPIEKEKIKEFVDSSELQDSQNLVNVTNKLIFGDDFSKSLTYEGFKSLFGDNEKENTLAFLLSSSGIRSMMLKNNV